MESTKYLCIFEDKKCPVKAAWKLSPESLVEFCKICGERAKWTTLTKAVEAFASMPKSTDSSLKSSATPFDLDLEKLRMEHDIELKKLDIELEKAKREAYKV